MPAGDSWGMLHTSKCPLSVAGLRDKSEVAPWDSSPQSLGSHSGFMSLGHDPS